MLHALQTVQPAHSSLERVLPASQHFYLLPANVVAAQLKHSRTAFVLLSTIAQQEITIPGTTLV